MASLTDILSNHRPEFAHVLPFEVKPEEILYLDLSANNKKLSQHPIIDSLILGTFIHQEMQNSSAKIAVGGYLEDRLIYKRSPHFGSGENARTIHLGIDIWCDEFTPVQAPIQGKVHSLQVNDNFADYGPTIILEHGIEGFIFYTLYGHLSKDCLKNLEPGQNIASGEPFAELGNSSENGHWPPHLHFQLITDMGEKVGDFPGVCSKNEVQIFKQLCPDPSVLLKF